MTRPFQSSAAGTSEFHEFLEGVRPKLRRMLVASRVPLADAEDLLQEALLVLLRHWGQLGEIGNREAWLLGTLRLTIAQYFRRRERERRFRELLALEPANRQAPPPQERQDSARDLATLTAAMPRRDRQAIWLRYGLELKPHEAAKSLGCLPDSVRKLSHRALARLRRRLAEDDDG
jgi:RNA polymerase sigma factor (sigma-70 family)